MELLHVQKEAICCLVGKRIFERLVVFVIEVGVTILRNLSYLVGLKIV